MTAMKRPQERRGPRARRARAGAADDRNRKRRAPTPGWKQSLAVASGWRNPRTPSVPATLELNLEEYFAATSLMGLLAAQSEEPDKRWCCTWSFAMGQRMASEARKRRRLSTK